MNSLDFNQHTRKFSKFYHYRNKTILTSTSFLLPLLKSYFGKLEPKKLTYRHFKNFSNQQFCTKLVKEMSDKNVDASQFELFQTIFFEFLNKLTTTKLKIIRNNGSSFVTKEVRKAIMTRLKLHNKFLQTKFQEFTQAYNKQREICVEKFRKVKKKGN